MPDILLITTSERVRNVFLSLEKSEGVRVRTAASVPLAELGISVSVPDCTFIHGRVSGQPVDLLVKHMKTILPKEANLAFLAEDPEDIAEAAKHGVTVFDMNIDDRILKRALTDVLQDLPNSLTGKVIEMQPALRHDERDSVTQEWQADVEEVGADDDSDDSEDLETTGAAADDGAAVRAALHLQSYGKGEGEGECEGEGEAQSASAEDAVAPEVQDRVHVKSTAVPAHPTVRELLEQVEFAGEMPSRKRGRPDSRKLAFAAAVVFMIVATAVLLQKKEVPRSADAAAESGRGPAQVARVATVASPAPATVAAAAPAAPVAAVAKTLQPARLPAAQKGLAALPPMLAKCRLDQEFGKSHPGWERYFGADYQYVLLKKDGVYRTINVLPRRNQRVPELFVRKVLLQFGGTESYEVHSKQKKGRLLVYRGTSKTGVAVSIYKDGSDRSTKSFALYYQ